MQAHSNRFLALLQRRDRLLRAGGDAEAPSLKTFWKCIRSELPSRFDPFTPCSVRSFFRKPHKKPLFIRPAIPVERDIQTRLKYPPAPRRREREVADGLVGTLVRLLPCLDREGVDAHPVKRILSSPPLLHLALRNLENQRRRTPIRQTDVVQEACFLVSSFLEFVRKRRDAVGAIPPDAELIRCFMRPSHVSSRPFADILRECSFAAEDDDVRFVLRAFREWKWKTAKGRRKRFDPSWRLTPRKRDARKTQWIFRRSSQPTLDRRFDADPCFAIGSVHRPEWRTLPARAYADARATWILSVDGVATRKDEKTSSAKKLACLDAVVATGCLSARDVEEERRVSLLQQRLYALLFSRVFHNVQRRFNQSVIKHKSPDTIPVVDKPSPTLTRPERRIHLEIRRMVPTIHAQRYRGMQCRDRYAQTKGIAVYWYDSHYADIVASLAEIENELAKAGVSLSPSKFERPNAQELRDLERENRLPRAEAIQISLRSFREPHALASALRLMEILGARGLGTAATGRPPPQSLSFEQRYRPMGEVRYRPDASGIIGDPYKGPRPWLSPTAFFHPKGWRDIRARVEDVAKNVYCLRTCRKHLDGFKLRTLKRDAFDIYAKLSEATAKGDNKTIRKLATAKLAAEIQKDLTLSKARGCHSIQWSIVPTSEKIKFVRARVLGMPDNKFAPAFAQCTFLFRNKQKFAAYDAKGKRVAGTEDGEFDVEDCWVFERILQKADPSSQWRVASRLILTKG